MKVITENGGIKARSVNDRAIEHSISQKTELSKKDERELSGKAERAVHQADKNAPKAETRNSAVPNRPVPAQQKKNGVAFEKPQYGETSSTSTADRKSAFEQRHIGAQAEIRQQKPSGGKLPPPKFPRGNGGKRKRNKRQTGLKTSETAEKKTAPTPFRPPKKYKLSPNQPKNRSYKLLKNGTVNNGGLTKKKERVIYSKQQEHKLKNAKPKKINKPVSSPAERLNYSTPKPQADRKTRTINRINLKKLKIKKVKKQRIRLTKEQSAALRNMKPLRLSAKKRKQSIAPRSMISGKKVLGGAAKVVDLANKPMEKVKVTVLSQRPNTDKTEDSGTEAVKLGAQSADYLERGLKTAKNVGTKTAEKSTKLAKRVYRKFHKPTRAEIKRHLRKQVDRQFSGQLRHLTKQAVNKGAKAAAKTTAKAARTAARTAQQAAQAAQKAVRVTARAVTSAASKLVSFISSTMPYSLIVIGAILLIIIICLCMTQFIGGAGGSVAGGGAWLVDDNSSQTPEEIYEGYKKFIEQAKEVMETQAKDALQSEVKETEEHTLAVGDVIELDDGKFTVTKIKEDDNGKQFELQDMQLTGWFPIFRKLSEDELYSHGFTLVSSSAPAKSAEQEEAAPKLKEIVIDLTARPERVEVPVERHDFTITDEHLGEGGQKAKFAANMAAIKLLKSLEAEDRLATPEEQETFSRYVGWGGLSQAFDENNSSWAAEHKELVETLKEDEYTAAKGTVLNAHYTTPTVINAIYKGLETLGFGGGNILESAMGVGNFFGVMPEEMRKAIFENLLNNRDIVVKDKITDADGREHYEINKKETDLAQEKARQMKEAFKRWLWDDPARRKKYVERYNNLFNCIVGRKFDGSHQTFPGMSPSISLKPHQLDAVMRAKFGGNTLLAHCVGAGKSFEMVAATMEKKRLGLINKACVVVPKHLVWQMANEWLRLYPQAKILTATEKDFDKDHRQKFIGRCCTGDYDAVIMSYEQFEKIPMSMEYRKNFIQREIDAMQSGIDELSGDYRSRTNNRSSIKDLEREKKRLETRLQKLIEGGGKTKDTSLTFEQLGFDSLVVDEAHNYKNGLVVSKMNRVSGVQTRPAQKSEDILMKTQYLNENYGEKNIIFATGTPVITPYQHSNTEFNINARFIGNRHNLNHR